MSYQNLVITGNVGRDAELTYTPQGIAVTKFTVAVNRVTGKGEDRKEKTTWFRVTIWRERAEALAQYIKKGDKILVAGEISLSVYIAKDGQAAGTLELTAHTVDLLGNNRSNGSAANAAEVEPVEESDVPF
jgi:single-strand DNA-binding protein